MHIYVMAIANRYRDIISRFRDIPRFKVSY